MNVMFVVPWDQEFGGVASVVGNLAKSLEGEGHGVVFLHPGSPDHPTRRTTIWGFTGYEINLRSPFVRERPVRSVVAFVLYLAFTLYRIASVIRAHKVQIVNIHYPVESFVYFGFLRWLMPFRLAVSVHGTDMFPDGRRMKSYACSLKFLVSSADTLVAPSRAFLRDCLSVFPEAAHKALCIHNGIDIDELLQIDEAITTAEWRPYILCIATHNEKKAIDVLLKAFVQVSKTHHDLRLVLVGDGPLRGQHEEEVASLSLKRKVTFLGWKGRPEIAGLLRDCEIFVLPSRSEPFGLVVAEALACRKAVVASRIGGIPEIIENGQSGILIEPDNPDVLARALQKVLDNDSFRESIAETGYRRVLENFGRDKMWARYGDLYSSLLDGRVCAGG